MKDEYVLITGIYGGIGNSICNIFKKNGYRIIGIDLHKYNNNDNVDIYFQCDLSVVDNQKKVLEQIKLFKITCIVHCAAIQICKPIWEYDENDFDITYNCNIRFLLTLVKNNIDQLKTNKTCIINIASVHSVCSSKYISLYSSSKACLVGLTKNMAIDLSEFGIRVVSISPGAVNTNMLSDGLKRDSNKTLYDLEQKHLLKKIGEPENISNFCYSIYKNNFINGVNLLIDGGISTLLYSE